MIIEFTGLPGSGKSFLSRRLAGELKKIGVNVAEPSRKIGHASVLLRLTGKIACVLVSIILHPLYSAFMLHSIRKTRQNSPANLVKSIFNLLFIRGLMVFYRRSGRIVLFDQGLIQGCASVQFGGSVSLEERFLRSLTLPEMVIRVRVPQATVLERLAGRRSGGGSRVESSPEAGLEQFAAALESVENYFLGTAMLVQELINDDNGVEENLSELKNSIVEIMNREKGHMP